MSDSMPCLWMTFAGAGGSKQYAEQLAEWATDEGIPHNGVAVTDEGWHYVDFTL